MEAKYAQSVINQLTISVELAETATSAAAVVRTLDAQIPKPVDLQSFSGFSRKNLFEHETKH
jgi:hypothetical protein